MILPLSQLANAIHSLKSAASSAVTASVQNLQSVPAPENDLLKDVSGELVNSDCCILKTLGVAKLPKHSVRS